MQSVPPSSRGEREKSRSLDLSSSLRVSVQPPVSVAAAAASDVVCPQASPDSRGSSLQTWSFKSS